ncbi:MAG: zinc ABC transporter substrate-binding protein [Saprospiraceae bacterium]|nr:zinc ABC transporter substrate-binding protein [Saprospiraceae bacterium]
MSETRPSVVATASMIADMVENIAGDLVDLTCIVPIGGDPHLYEPTPKDARTVAEADILFKNGLTFEGWLNELIENAGSEAQVVTVTSGIKPIESLIYQNATDPHAWMDAENGLVYIQNILATLIEYDSVNSMIYQANYDIYRSQFLETHKYIIEQIETIPVERRILITSHDAFQYYGRKYGLQLESVLGTSTDADVQTADIIRLNEVIRKNQVPALFIESTINPKILEQLARDNKIRVGGKLYADSIGDKDSPAPNYLQMLRHNTEVIVKALTTSFEDEAPATTSSSKSVLLYVLLGAIMVLIFFLLVRKFNLG